MTGGLERAARRKLREAKFELYEVQDEWASLALLEDPDRRVDWTRAKLLEERLKVHREQVDRLEKEVARDFGDPRRAAKRKSLRGKPAGPANPGFDPFEKDFGHWLKASVERGDIGCAELREISKACDVDHEALSKFASGGEVGKLKGAEIGRLSDHCRRFFGYRILGVRVSEDLLRFLFFSQQRVGATDAEICRLTRLSSETLRKWRVGDAEPGLLPTLACFEALGLQLVPVPKGNKKGFLKVGLICDLAKKRNVPLSEMWSELSSEDVTVLEKYRRAFEELAANLRGRWR